MRALSQLGLAALTLATGFVLSCGSEGSLALSGSNDWTYDGMGGSAPGGSPENGGSAESGTSAGGAASGGTSSTGGATASGGATNVGGSTSGASGMPPAGGSSPGGSATTGGAAPTGGSAGSGSTLYHQLANWVSPEAGNPNHHGRIYFLAHGHKDENGVECTSCHGANYEGGSGPACSNCHSEWRSDCSFCHGTDSAMSNPPLGVFDEADTNTLAVGRHEAHLSSGSSHQAFACATCHTIPPAEDVDHTLSYQPSDGLATPGHHGDVTFASTVTGMTFDVSAVMGATVTARGACVGACHSNGRGGAPVRAAYWAGGAWTSGCGNCHEARPNTGHHGHALDEGGTCADCHASSTPNSYSVAAHFNGYADFLGTVVGQGMTLKTDTTCASGVRCNGTCHGNNEGHDNRCW